MTSQSSVIYRPTYGDLSRGDAVKIQNERGRWSFRNYCVNADTGSEWIDVFGGTRGCETLRAFRPERVTPLRRRRR